MRRALYWLGVLIAASMVVAGSAVAWRGYQETAGPGGAVHGYFTALMHGDAPQALAYGDVPDGPRSLLTSVVLREQQRIAPIRNVQVGTVKEHGSTASVDVDYLLGFAQGPVEITVTVGLHKAGSRWRLDRVALATQLVPTGARDRESIVGSPIPADTTLLFPGALPVQLDTPYLQLDARQDNVSFDALSTTGVFVQPSALARDAITRQVQDRLHQCLTGPDDPSCPLPSQRFVPGSVHGALAGEIEIANLQLDSADPAGKITLTASAKVSGRYRELDFANRQVAKQGNVQLHVAAAAYAVSPLRVVWTS